MYNRSNVYKLIINFFFFKQKTAYEMRISDWSSDVCSSDLREGHDLRRCHAARRAQHHQRHLLFQAQGRSRRRLFRTHARHADGDARRGTAGADPRSEEHTSELQSLMRISYAVFCLKKKKNIIKTTKSE